MTLNTTIHIPGGLDLIAALGCGWLALILFALHVVSSPSRRSWMTIPEYVRHGFAVTGCVFLVRAANFATLQPEALGHANAEGLMVLLALVYTVTALAVWVVRARLKNQGWSRLDWLRGLMADHPEVVGGPMTMTEVADTCRAMGATVAEPPEPDPPIKHAHRPGGIFARRGPSC